MSTSYDDYYGPHKPKFQIGDKVTLTDLHIFDGDTWQEAPKGAKGTIEDIMPDGDCDNYSEPYYSVNWNKGTKHMTRGNRLENSYVDESCLEPTHKPVTKKELDEVYKILGVS